MRVREARLKVARIGMLRRTVGRKDAAADGL